MANVQFQEEKRGQFRSKKRGGITGWLINRGIVPNEKAASVVLFIAAMAMFAAAFFIVGTSGEEVVVIVGTD